ncbi:hypothetical protein GCM10028808_42480 [Spirosoma migulaei]
MKKVSFLIALIGVVAGCKPAVDVDLARLVEGVYQLNEYSSPTRLDVLPSGTLLVTRLDNEHVRIQAIGLTGKTKIAYTLPKVLVINVNRTTNALSVKGKDVGQVVDDGASRFVTIMPSSKIKLSAMVF